MAGSVVEVTDATACKVKRVMLSTSYWASSLAATEKERPEVNGLAVCHLLHHPDKQLLVAAGGSEHVWSTSPHLMGLMSPRHVPSLRSSSVGERLCMHTLFSALPIQAAQVHCC